VTGISWLIFFDMDELLVVVGPTASGKTQLGIEAARTLAGAVVSADSRQVYAGMNVGTASPQSSAAGQAPQNHATAQASQSSAAGQAPHDILVPDAVGGIDHYLLNIRRPDQQLTLADWQAAAFTVIDSIHKQGRAPLLVGGTMLYMDSVVRNYAVPSVAPDSNLRARLAARSADELYRQLVSRDPAASEFVEPHNKRRIIRALEVMEATGEPFSRQRQAQAPRYDVTMIGLFPGWEKLERRIVQRSAAMFEEGLLEETQQLIEQYGVDLPLLATLNYREAVAVLEDRFTRDQTVERMIRADMRYARRQMAWWKGRSEITWFESVPEALKKTGKLGM